MDSRPASADKVAYLMGKGAIVPIPGTVHIDDDVDLARVSAEGLTLFPGCRIHGAATLICPGVVLGAEGPVCVEDCSMGPGVELKGGYFRQSVFLEKAALGLGAQVREGCLLEEEASAAHCVGLKQTILFPFVTVGSLVNFCDCLMAGGTGPTDHSEVGSSYIHFNFTPDGDKTTASLFGDVPRGVMLDRPAIFLGGQGGAVGPVRVEYGTVVVAGSILRRDVLSPGKLVSSPPVAAFERDRHSHAYGGLARVVRNNLLYLANLAALEQWYHKVRRPFFALQEKGEALCDAALEVIAGAKRERANRLVVMAAKLPADQPRTREFREKVAEACALFQAPVTMAGPQEKGFLAGLASTARTGGYVEAIQALAPEVSALGVLWLQGVVDGLMREAAALLPALRVTAGER